MLLTISIFRATEDKQRLHKLKTFKELMFDLVARKNWIRVQKHYSGNIPKLVCWFSAKSATFLSILLMNISILNLILLLLWFCYQSCHVPRLIYGMCSLEYRCWQLLPTVLDLLESSIQVNTIKVERH